MSPVKLIKAALVGGCAALGLLYTASSSFSTVRGSTPLIDACVPTGMNTGVSTMPCAVCSNPARAPVSGHVA